MLEFLLLLAGEEKAPLIEKVYYSYHNDMLRYAASQLRSRGYHNYTIDCEDVVQETYKRLIKYAKMECMEWEYKALKAYVFNMLTNVINDKGKEKLFDSFDEEEYFGISENEFIRRVSVKENFNRIVKIARKMDELYTYTLVMRYYQDKDVREIAEFMGVSEKTVYARLERGRVKLLKLLEKEGLIGER